MPDTDHTEGIAPSASLPLSPSTTEDAIRQLEERKYREGFVTDIDQDTLPPGLDEDVIRLISLKKDEPEWLLEWRLKSYRNWLTMTEPSWASVSYPPIDFQSISYYSAPRSMADNQPKSLDDVDPEILETYEKLGIPLLEQKKLAGVAVDAVFDSVSVATTFKGKLAEVGVIFCSFSEAVREYPELVQKYLGSVVPYRDNYYAALNSAVFTDGSFVYVPPGVKCPMELSTYLGAMSATWRAVQHRCGMRTSCTLQWWNCMPTRTRRSAIRLSRTGTREMKKAWEVSTTLSPSEDCAMVTGQR